MLNYDNNPSKSMKRDAADNQHVCDGFAAFFIDKFKKKSTKSKAIRFFATSGRPPASFTMFNSISDANDTIVSIQ